MITEQAYCKHCTHHDGGGCDITWTGADRLIACVEAGWRETVPPYERTEEMALFGESHSSPHEDEMEPAELRFAENFRQEEYESGPGLND